MFEVQLAGDSDQAPQGASAQEAAFAPQVDYTKIGGRLQRGLDAARYPIQVIATFKAPPTSAILSDLNACGLSLRQMGQSVYATGTLKQGNQLGRITARKELLEVERTASASDPQ